MNSPLNNKKNDLLASAGKSILGAFPLVGPLLAEIVDHLIPNQRVDRLASYVKELETRLAETEESLIRKSVESSSSLALVEDGFIAASRAVTKERISYIASTVANGLTKEDIDNNRQRYLLNLLSELNDEEVLWLRFFLEPTFGGDQEFREKNKEVFEPANAFIGAQESELDKSSIQKSYKEHLERLGLVKFHISVDRDTGLPEFDKLSGKPRTSYTTITRLGRMLLREIGMIDRKNHTKS